MITIHDLHKHYDGGRIKALNGLDLQVDAGAIVSLMGPSGSGKSTLLNLIGMLDVPDRGEILIEDRPLASYGPGWLWRRRQVGIVFQFHHLLPRLDLHDNIMVPLAPERLQRREKRRRALAIIERLGLTPRLHARPAELSGGERQRAALARALVNHPRILLADEPTGSLDRETGERVIDLLCEVTRDQGITTLVVTHDRPIAERSDRILELIDGRIAAPAQASGEPKAVIRE
ncbi:MAG: ABC transporter ATP-binding protein [Wenzhouxiangellaceae bacterium]|nr:ABC transporter ATP-binding protein [Wenzhouxiangellaceae bacterium]